MCPLIVLWNQDCSFLCLKNMRLSVLKVIRLVTDKTMYLIILIIHKKLLTSCVVLLHQIHVILKIN